MTWMCMMLGAFVAAVTAQSPATQPAPAAPLGAELVTSGEMARLQSWMTSHLTHAPDVPWSFTYGGRPSAELLRTWKLEQASRELDGCRRERVLTYRDPKSGLVVRCVAVVYRDYPTVEWTLYLKNTGSSDTPILADALALDTRFERSAAGEFLLHHGIGSPCKPNDYQPLETPLGPKATKRIAAAGGRPSNSDLPYFNIEWPTEGIIVVVGWPGQWAAEFTREGDRALRIRAGQELTHFMLHPGEEVRSPLIVCQFYQGDYIRSQNVWRRWMVAHNLPRPGGKLVATHYGGCFGNLLPRAEEELAVIDGYVREGVKLDYWFLDAGWYPNKGSWESTGTWEVDTARFPRGVREVADRAHASGMRFVLWFEPERVTAGSWLAENHPEWVLGGRKGGLLNLGNPDAWTWVVERFDNLITTQAVDVYRQDFNIDPLQHWRTNDSEDRQGITEIKHVAGYLAYWDELLRRHPGLLIDTCASGGRRNDLETLRRSVPLLRSDYFSNPTAQQCQTYGISLWMPYYGSGLGASDPYWFRSCIFPASRVGWDTRNRDLDYKLLRRMLGEFRQVEPYLLGDFYPLTPYTLENNAWMAWQFDRPDLHGGMIQVFRRDESTQETMRLRLKGLAPEGRYAVRHLDAPTTTPVPGEDLMTNGLLVVLKERRGATIITYRMQ